MTQLSPGPHDATTTPCRSFDDLRGSGLLWLINRVVFHPWGLALAVHGDNPDGTGLDGWSLEAADEPFSFPADAERDAYLRAVDTIALARHAAGPHMREISRPFEPSPPHDDDGGLAKCRVCGCTEDTACPSGCTWIDDPEVFDGDLCSACLPRVQAGAVAPTEGPPF